MIINIIKTCKIDSFQLQEHFKTTKTLDSFFKREFPTNDSFVLPVHREAFQDSGRAKGGLAQLSCKHLDIRIERISTKNWRIQAQILHINAHKIIWLNCYFPTDPQTLVFDDNELSTVLNDIENVLDNNSFDDCILGGDFNYDSRRTSGYANSVRDFLSKLGIISVWDKFQIDYTHVHTDLKSFAVLDHFFVNQRLLDQIEDAGPIHLGDILSRHSPIMVKLKLNQIITSKTKQSDTPIMRKPSWYKASMEEKLRYTESLDTQLRELSIPDSLNCQEVDCQCFQHGEERDKHVIDILCTLVETSHSCIPLSGGSKKGTADGHCLPNWSTTVAPLKDDSLFWHSVWKDAGSPKSGALHQVMCHARRKYHAAVKQSKRMAGHLKSAQLLEASETGDIQLMKELKNTLNRKSYGQTVPDSLDGKVTPEAVLERFRECYQDLFNSAGTQDAMTAIKAKLTELIDARSVKEVEKVTGNIVKQACSKMKAGKNDVTEAYSSRREL